MFPGLAAASALRQRGAEVTVWLSGRGVESEAVRGWDGPVQRVVSRGFPSGLSVGTVAAAWQLPRAALVCRARMRRHRPRALLAMGSYASVGPALGAWSLGVPVVLHEANAVPGRAISLLSRLAVRVGLAFEQAAPYFPPGRAVRTGMPVRRRLDGRFEPGTLERDVFTVLIMGGSQGARFLNTVAVEAIVQWRSRGVEVQVVHLAGTAEEAAVRARYAAGGVRALVFGFLDDMGKAYGAADIAVCRAGAGTCAELALCGLPALMVPLPGARRNHQACNARAVAAAGGGVVLEQAALGPGRLREELARWRGDPEGLARLGAGMRAMAAPDASAALADLVMEAARGGANG